MTKVKDANSPAIEISGKEFGADWDDAFVREKILPKMLALYQGKSFVNAETGHSIQIGKRGIKKIHSHFPDQLPAIALAKLPELISTAALVEEASPREEDGNIRRWLYFANEAIIRGTVYDIEIKVREDGNGHWFYDQLVTHQKEEDSAFKPGAAPERAVSQAAEPSSSNIGPTSPEVKPNIKESPERFSLIEAFRRE